MHTAAIQSGKQSGPRAEWSGSAQNVGPIPAARPLDVVGGRRQIVEPVPTVLSLRAEDAIAIEIESSGHDLVEVPRRRAYSRVRRRLTMLWRSGHSTSLTFASAPHGQVPPNWSI